MILDIRFKDKAPSQYQGVRMTSLYTSKEVNAKPEIIIHFREYDRGPLFIDLDSIVSITTTND